MGIYTLFLICCTFIQFVGIVVGLFCCCTFVQFVFCWLGFTMSVFLLWWFLQVFFYCVVLSSNFVFSMLFIVYLRFISQLFIIFRHSLFLVLLESVVLVCLFRFSGFAYGSSLGFLPILFGRCYWCFCLLHVAHFVVVCRCQVSMESFGCFCFSSPSGCSSLAREQPRSRYQRRRQYGFLGMGAMHPSNPYVFDGMRCMLQLRKNLF